MTWPREQGHISRTKGHSSLKFSENFTKGSKSSYSENQISSFKNKGYRAQNLPGVVASTPPPHVRARDIERGGKSAEIDKDREGLTWYFFKMVVVLRRCQTLAFRKFLHLKKNVDHNGLCTARSFSLSVKPFAYVCRSNRSIALRLCSSFCVSVFLYFSDEIKRTCVWLRSAEITLTVKCQFTSIQICYIDYQSLLNNSSSD